MLEYIETGEPWNGEPINEIQHPRAIEFAWSAKELAAIGLRVRVQPEPEPAPPPPEYPDLEPWQFEGMVEVLGIGVAIEGAIDVAFRGDPERKAFVLARYRKSRAYSIEDPLFAALAPLVGVTMDDIRAAWKVAAAQRSRDV